MRATLENVKKHVKIRGLTKKQIKRHLKDHKTLWKKLAEIPNASPVDKEKICKELYYQEIKNNCFLCEITKSEKGTVLPYDDCFICPVKWGRNHCEMLRTPYSDWRFSHKKEEKKELALKIANLPLKKGWMDFLYPKKEKK